MTSGGAFSTVYKSDLLITRKAGDTFLNFLANAIDPLFIFSVFLEDKFSVQNTYIPNTSSSCTFFWPHATFVSPNRHKV